MNFIKQLLNKDTKDTDFEDVSYSVDIEELRERLLYRRIIEWNPNQLTLEDGTVVTLEMSESVCCAYAGGRFKNVILDAMITDVEITEMEEVPDDDTRINRVKVFIYHNQNTIAQADMEANAGNGGYYYSVGSIVIGKIHFPIVEA